MKKIVILLIILAPIIAKAQEDNQKAEETIINSVYIGFRSNLDMNLNAYRQAIDENGFDYYDVNPHYSFALDLGVQVSKRLRPRVEVSLATTSYGFNWSETYPTFNKTVTHLIYLGTNARLDYLLFNSKVFQVYLSPAIKFEYLIDSYVTTWKTDGNTNHTYYKEEMKEAYPNTIGAGALSTIFKYNISDRLGITVTPEYSIYFRKFVVSNDKLYQRLSLNFGVEFRL